MLKIGNTVFSDIGSDFYSNIANHGFYSTILLISNIKKISHKRNFSQKSCKSINMKGFSIFMEKNLFIALYEKKSNIYKYFRIFEKFFRSFNAASILVLYLKKSSFIKLINPIFEFIQLLFPV